MAYPKKGFLWVGHLDCGNTLGWTPGLRGIGSAHPHFPCLEAPGCQGNFSLIPVSTSAMFFGNRALGNGFQWFSMSRDRQHFSVSSCSRFLRNRGKSFLLPASPASPGGARPTSGQAANPKKGFTLGCQPQKRAKFGLPTQNIGNKGEIWGPANLQPK